MSQIPRIPTTSLDDHINLKFDSNLHFVPLQRRENTNPKYLFDLPSNDDSEQSQPVNATRFSRPNQVRFRDGNSRSVWTYPNRLNNTESTTRTDRTRSNRSFIAAVVEGRGIAKGEIGLAFFNLNGNSLVLSQFSDDYTYHRLMAKLDIYDPVEIILPSSIADPRMNLLPAQLRRKFVNIAVTGVERRFFNEAAGIEYIRKLCASELDTLEISIKNKYYCLSASSALIRYIEHIQNMLLIDKSLKIEYHGSEDSIVIDFITARALEIVVNQTNPKSKDTLFGLLNFTRTRSGGRLLRATLMEPPSDEPTIQCRLDCVEELLTTPDVLPQLQHLLNVYVDVEHVISAIIQKPKVENDKSCERKIDSIILLKNALELIPALKMALQFLKHPLFQTHCEVLSDPKYEEILSLINEVILENCKVVNGTSNAKSQKCWAIRPDVCEGLEVARQTYQERLDDIINYQEYISDKYHIPVLLGYAVQRGYYLYFNETESSFTTRNLPNEFCKVNKKGNNIHFNTEELIKLNTRITMALKTVFEKSASVVNELIHKIRDYVIYLQNLTSVLSFVDLLMSFAEAAMTYGLVKPTFGNSMEITNGWHPILGKDRSTFVSNSTSASKRKNFTLIAGPNMSGKSTYLKQLALLQIMAQSGSFVAAEEASFRLTSQICSRLGTNDDIESNSSTFMIEMKETFYIFKNFRRNALIIIDELGRGTSREDGLGLCFAVAENLIHSDGLTFFVTHFYEIMKLANKYPSVSMYVDIKLCTKYCVQSYQFQLR
ncbi:mutS protein 4-like isoform X1 [Leptotrombidium deliense]|uniref:MutS protein 4-like isoform X1 n=1 Tax=Leptotrombidium deliense TaxID=299467 RepID=A0A443SKK7_9ACAR|nr:mutS protein 4-like isoform X1 [Leptotrombidium deliense]